MKLSLLTLLLVVVIGVVTMLNTASANRASNDIFKADFDKKFKEDILKNIPSKPDFNSPQNSKFHRRNEKGSKYVYKVSKRTKTQNGAVVEDRQEEWRILGGYDFSDPKGRHYHISYTTDKDGVHSKVTNLVGDDLPNKIKRN